MKIRKHDRGVTLVELSTTLLTAAVALTLGIPAFGVLRADFRYSQVSSDLMASFALARSEAVRRGVEVSVCPSGDGLTCTDPPSADWSTGWIVAAAGGRGAQVIEATRFGRPPLFVVASDQALARGVTFSSTGLPSACGSFAYSDRNTHSLFRLSPIGRLEHVP